MTTQIQTANSFTRFAMNATNVSAHRTEVISTLGQHLACQPVFPETLISNNIRSRQHQKAGAREWKNWIASLWREKMKSLQLESPWAPKHLQLKRKR